MKFRLVVCFLMITKCDCFLRRAFDENVQYKVEIDVGLSEGRRTRRSADDSFHPQTYDLDLEVEGSKVHLHLERNDEIKTNIPTYSLNHGLISQEDLLEKEDSIFYQDVQTGASFVVQYDTNNSPNMFGMFHKSGGNYILQTPKTERLSLQRGISKFEIIKEKHKPIEYNDFLENGNVMKNLRKVHRHKRATGSNQIELLVVCDFAVYSYWYNESTKSTEKEKQTEAFVSVRQYYAFVINGMDAMYRGIQTTFTLSVVFSGIVISDTAENATWTETIKNTTSTPNTVDSSTGLDNFHVWVEANSARLPDRDHAMLFTRYDLASRGSTGTAGTAYVRTICSGYSQSIVEDDFNFLIITVASHELGHSLGAYHDGTQGNSCNLADAYIMAASMGPQKGATATHPW